MDDEDKAIMAEYHELCARHRREAREDFARLERSFVVFFSGLLMMVLVAFLVSMVFLNG